MIDVGDEVAFVEGGDFAQEIVGFFLIVLLEVDVLILDVHVVQNEARDDDLVGEALTFLENRVKMHLPVLLENSERLLIFFSISFSFVGCGAAEENEAHLA